MLRSSEFYVALAALVGAAGVGQGWWTRAEFDEFLRPALLYVAARITSKVAKAVPSFKKEAK